jgi:hypothetical protein
MRRDIVRGLVAAVAAMVGTAMVLTIYTRMPPSATTQAPVVQPTPSPTPELPNIRAYDTTAGRWHCIQLDGSPWQCQYQPAAATP